MKSTMKKSFKRSSILVLLCAGLMTVGCSNMNSQSNANSETTEQPADGKSTTTAETSEQSDSTIVANLTTNLVASGIDAKVISAIPTQVEGLYWVTAEGIPPFFTDKAGKHVIQGQVVQVGGTEPVDISAKLGAQINKDKLAAVAKEDMIIYPAKGETKGIIYAFTDVTCPYCRKFHNEIEDINGKGIEVRYLAWPRNDRALPVMESVWCSDDRKAAMALVQSGKEVESATNCESSVVKAQTDLGFAVGVHGTPAVYTVNGEQIGGYLPADAVAKALGL